MGPVSRVVDQTLKHEPQLLGLTWESPEPWVQDSVSVFLILYGPNASLSSLRKATLSSCNTHGVTVEPLPTPLAEQQGYTVQGGCQFPMAASGPGMATARYNCLMSAVGFFFLHELCHMENGTNRQQIIFIERFL